MINTQKKLIFFYHLKYSKKNLIPFLVRISFEMFSFVIDFAPLTVSIIFIDGKSS